MPTPFMVAASLVLATANPVLVYVSDSGARSVTEIMTLGRAGVCSLGISQPQSGTEFLAALSPDGTRAAFISHGELWTASVAMKSGGRRPQCSVIRQPNGHWDGAVQASVKAAGPLTWLPDGRTLVFVRPSAPGSSRGAVIKLTTGPGGSALTESNLLVGAGSDQDANAVPSPDGSSILFDRLAAGKERRLHLVGADGRNLIDITPAAGDWSAGSWSPDGSKIAVKRLAPAGSSDQSGIYVMARDGRDLKFVEGTGPDDEKPLFSPDGSEVLFARQAPANSKSASGLFVAGAGDGRRPVRFRGIDDSRAVPVQWVGLK